MDHERASRVVDTLSRSGLDALVCRAPEHVFMLSGYLPVLGNSFCVLSLEERAPQVRLVVPSDEHDLIRDRNVAEVRDFTEETLEHIGTTLDAVGDPLGAVMRAAGLCRTGITVGYEGGHSPIASPYMQVGVAGPATLDLFRTLLPGAEWRDATAALRALGAIKTPREIDGVRRSIGVAHDGFVAARSAVKVGATEAEVAATVLAMLTRAGYRQARADRVVAHVHVMSGPRAALAYRAFNMTSARRIESGETVLVQMEVCIDGYWAELTRTFYAGGIDATWKRAHAACIAAQDAALMAIRDGVAARDADAAARRVMENAGLGTAFKHGLGHGVGFQAINHGVAPILHPRSEETLHTGMLHNLEPAVYLDGIGGLRLNDNVRVGSADAELLSAEIPRDLSWAVVGA